MTEVLFYHLTLKPLEDVLPGLLETCLQREWRVVVQAGSAERVTALDSLLWSYRDDSFLPHGKASDGEADRQPVFLTDGPDNPNGASVRFLVDRATAPDLSPYARGVFLFDGNDEAAVSDARQQWKALKAAGHALTYWQQTDDGRWQKKA